MVSLPGKALTRDATRRLQIRCPCSRLAVLHGRCCNHKRLGMILKSARAAHGRRTGSFTIWPRSDDGVRVPSKGRSSHSPEVVDVAEHRMAEQSDMLSKGELPVVPDTQENLEGIAEHLSSVNCDVGLPSISPTRTYMC